MKNKVIVISTVGLIYDGITSVILSHLQSMDLSDLDIYVAATIKLEPSIKKRIEQLGCHLIDFPSRRRETVKYFFLLTSFIRKNRICVMHAHGNSGTLAIEMLAGWLGGCNKRIAHSHNTSCDQVKADKLLRPIFNLFYTDALACGDAAGKWLFGNKPFMVLKNGRDIELFSYKIETRKKIREKYQLGKNIAIGHVGGFVPQKNHEFLLEIYWALLVKQPNIKLFMIGDGVLRPAIEHKATDLGIRDKIVFTGNIDNVPEMLSAIDGMILPSLFEGLPLVAIEWQIAGLPCVLADTITKECICTRNVKQLSLQDKPEDWADAILQLINENNRPMAVEHAADQIRQAGFDIKDEASKLKKIYLGKSDC